MVEGCILQHLLSLYDFYQVSGRKKAILASKVFLKILRMISIVRKTVSSCN